MRESGEDYLETIYLLGKRLSFVRAVDIANELNYSKPSITRALGILRTKGLIVTDKDNHIVLTELGRQKAKEIFERHQTLTHFLMAIGVSEENAARDACRIEHIICDESLTCIREFIKNRHDCTKDN